MQNKIVFFTDLHYGINGENRAGKIGINTYGNLEDEIKKLKQEIDKIDPEIVVNLGDVISHISIDRDIENYNRLLNIFDYKNLYHSYGNHDVFNLNISDLEKITKQPARYSFVNNGIRHIFLDAIRIENVEISEETIKWLKEQLNIKNENVIIYSHFPISLDSKNVSYYHSGKENRCFIDKSAEILDLLKESNCIAFISGHTHFYYKKIIDNIMHITIPAFAEEKDNNPALEYAIFDYKSLEIEIKKLT